MIFYDFEVFKYDWLVVLIDVFNQSETVIVNDPNALEEYYAKHKKDIFIGYNSRNYDQYILKAILCGFDPKEVNDFIIVEGRKGWEFSNAFMQIPLINFDIMPSPPVGLKTLEGFMGNDIKETSVPFTIDRALTAAEIEETIQYCRHDVEQTIEVFSKKKEEFDSHLGLIKAFDLPLTHLNKTKPQLSAIILNCTKQKYNDEFDLIIPNTLVLDKYEEVLSFYKNPINHRYDKKLELEVAGVKHVFGWGGIHGAIPKYSGEGIYLNIDVASYYPALMIEYGFGSRNMANPDKYREIRDLRLRYKKEKNPMQAPLKIVLNSTYGAMKDKYNALYDPRQANNVCVSGQLLLLDLIEKLEPYCELIQSNTDGVLIKIPDTDAAYATIDDVCFEWEQRTRMVLEFDTYCKVYQKDVNNYIIVDDEGNYKSKGAYVKKPTPLDNDLPIVKTALLDYFLEGVLPEQTINDCESLMQFQKIVKVSGKYSHALYNPKITVEKIRDEGGRLKTVKVFDGGHIQKDKTFRVFADNREGMGGIFKVKQDGSNPQKFADTPDKANLYGSDITTEKVWPWLDKYWYIAMANKRLGDFGVKV